MPQSSDFSTSNVTIKNIIFDIGGVLMRWKPERAVKKLIDNKEFDTHELTKKIFMSDVWAQLDKGAISENEAVNIFHDETNIETDLIVLLLKESKKILEPMQKSINLAKNLNRLGFKLYILTNNTNEILDYLKSTYNFLALFDGIVSSSHIGVLKPNQEIYIHLLKKYKLINSESIFLDDNIDNINGAKSIGINAIHFGNVNNCIKMLKTYGINI